ncbi:hypothetical protein Pelo_16222 [Pelomyxa schiedti]|nr:hypothetical protein Pelo_16222 [Pelomyxa schiedti]
MDTQKTVMSQPCRAVAQSIDGNNKLIRGVTASSTERPHVPDCVIDYSHTPLTSWMSQLGCATGQYLLFEMNRPCRIPVFWIRTAIHPCAPKDITVSGSLGQATGPWVALCHCTARCADPWQRFGVDDAWAQTEFRWVRVFFDSTHMNPNPFHVMCSGVKFWD